MNDRENHLHDTDPERSPPASEKASGIILENYNDMPQQAVAPPPGDPAAIRWGNLAARQLGMDELDYWRRQALVAMGHETRLRHENEHAIQCHGDVPCGACITCLNEKLDTATEQIDATRQDAETTRLALVSAMKLYEDEKRDRKAIEDVVAQIRRDQADQVRKDEKQQAGNRRFFDHRRDRIKAIVRHANPQAFAHIEASTRIARHRERVQRMNRSIEIRRWMQDFTDLVRDIASDVQSGKLVLWQP